MQTGHIEKSNNRRYHISPQDLKAEHHNSHTLSHDINFWYGFSLKG